MRRTLNSPLLLILSFAVFFLASGFQTQQFSRVSPWLWVLVIASIIFVIALLLIRNTKDSIPPPVVHTHAPEPVVQASTPPPVVDTRSPEPAVQSFQAADKLIIIEGIGPKIEQILFSAGIKTFAQLAAMDGSKIEEIVRQGGVRLVNAKSWPEQARLAAAGDMAGLKALQDRLTAGR